jgi:hypothetical protein
MRANLFPIFNNSFLVYKEALKNNSGINFLKLGTTEKKAVVPFAHKELPEICL